MENQVTTIQENLEKMPKKVVFENLNHIFENLDKDTIKKVVEVLENEEVKFGCCHE